MDPDVCLHELRQLAGKGRWSKGDVARMAELVEALDGWLAGGGFLPKRWAR